MLPIILRVQSRASRPPIEVRQLLLLSRENRVTLFSLDLHAHLSAMLHLAAGGRQRNFRLRLLFFKADLNALPDRDGDVFALCKQLIHKLSLHLDELKRVQQQQLSLGRTVSNLRILASPALRRELIVFLNGAGLSRNENLFATGAIGIRRVSRHLHQLTRAAHIVTADRGYEIKLV